MGKIGKILLYVLGGLVVLAVIGSMIDPPAEPVTETTTAEAAAPTAPSGDTRTAVERVTVAQILAAYDDNGVAAEARFEDKIIEVTGRVSSIDKDITGTPYVKLDPPGDFAVAGFQAMFRNTANVASLKSGATLTVRCRVDGKLINVIGRDCAIVPGG